MFLPVAQRGVWSPQPGGTPQTNPRPPQALRPVPQLCDPQDLEAWAVRGTDRAMQTGLCRGNESRRGGQNDLSLFSGLGLLSRGSGEGRGVILKARWHVAPLEHGFDAPQLASCTPAPTPTHLAVHPPPVPRRQKSTSTSTCHRTHQSLNHGVHAAHRLKTLGRRVPRGLSGSLGSTRGLSLAVQDLGGLGASPHSELPILSLGSWRPLSTLRGRALHLDSTQPSHPLPA